MPRVSVKKTGKNRKTAVDALLNRAANDTLRNKNSDNHGGAMTTPIKAKKAALIKLPDVNELLKSFLDSQDIREISKKAYRSGLDKFFAWLNTSGIRQPDRETILKFKSTLVESGAAANTVNCYLTAVKRFFSYLEGRKKYPNIAKDIKGVTRPRGHLREPLTVGQVRSLLNQVDTSTIQGKRDFAIINLLARTGLRTIEVARASVEDLKQEGGEALLYVMGKGRDSKDDFVLLTEPALRPILAYLKARGWQDPEDPLFASLSDRNYGGRLSTRTIRKILKDNLRAIDIDSPKLSSHSLRHFFATHSLRSGAELQQVQAAMRHASIKTTERYLHNLDRIERGAERFIKI